jgi:predicted PurR-regulated permease PerM
MEDVVAGGLLGTIGSVSERERVPVRTIMATIGLVLGTVVGIWLLRKVAHTLALLIVSAFFATVLTPAVDLVKRRAHVKRGHAVAIVFLLLIVTLAGLMYAFIRPLVDQTREAVDNFPTYLSDAQKGKGPLGGIVRKYDLERRYEENKDKISDSLSKSSSRLVDYASRAFAGILSLLTVLVLTVMMVLYGPDLLSSGLGALSPPRRARVKAVAADCAKAITGYVMGNLLISVIAGALTFFALWIFGVPFKGVLALWTAFADLIPLVGATLGAIPTIGVAFLHSVPAGVGMLIFYTIYQQFENHVLQPQIMAKTVQINQLFVLVSVLLGVEVFGILGALLAIPAAGVISVIVRDLWDNRKGKLKEEPTIGEDKIPVDAAIASADAGESAADAAAHVAAHADDPETDHAAAEDTPEPEPGPQPAPALPAPMGPGPD